MTNRNANSKQIAGDHYQAALQPWDLFLELYGPSFLTCNAAKYLVRWRKKNGLEDLKKAQHYVEKAIEAVHDGHVNTALVDLTLTRIADRVRLMCTSGGTPELEYVIIDLLLRWSDVKQLEQANLLLESLISNHEFDSNKPYFK